MPRIKVSFFGPARDLAGEPSISLDIDEGETVGGVARRLAEKYPRLGAALGLRLAVNRAYVPLDRTLSDGDEIAVIPPVSGGAPSPRVGITRDPIDLSAMVRQLQTDGAGAVVLFLGTVRAESQDQRTLVALDYYAYEEMALEQLGDIRYRAMTKYDILDAAIVHRLGRIELGEVSIAIVVGSAHRVPAFKACHWLIDAVKTDAPIWKKDIWADGSQTWVDPTRS
jgi:molybdopterin synthase catalytic subunit